MSLFHNSVVNVTFLSIVLGSCGVTCHGDNSFPFILVPWEDSDLCLTTFGVNVVLEGKLLELEVEGLRDEGFEPVNEDSKII